MDSGTVSVLIGYLIGDVVGSTFMLIAWLHDERKKRIQNNYKYKLNSLLEDMNKLNDRLDMQSNSIDYLEQHKSDRR